MAESEATLITHKSQLKVACFDWKALTKWTIWTVDVRRKPRPRITQTLLTSSCPIGGIDGLLPWLLPRTSKQLVIKINALIISINNLHPVIHGSLHTFVFLGGGLGSWSRHPIPISASHWPCALMVRSLPVCKENAEVRFTITNWCVCERKYLVSS